MDKHAVTHTLQELAAVLGLKGESAARVRVVRRDARSEIIATGRSTLAVNWLSGHAPESLFYFQ